MLGGKVGPYTVTALHCARAEKCLGANSCGTLKDGVSREGALDVHQNSSTFFLILSGLQWGGTDK